MVGNSTRKVTDEEENNKHVAHPLVAVSIKCKAKGDNIPFE